MGSALIQMAFSLLQEVVAASSVGTGQEIAASSNGHQFVRPNMVNGGIPAPPPTYVPPVGSSFNTWPNVYTNLKNIDYCTDQFSYITNRVSASTPSSRDRSSSKSEEG